MPDKPPPARVVFLGGLGRSGTTLLERLLGEVPGVTPLGEVVHLWARGVLADEPCGCRRPFSACPFWREVGERAFGGWPDDLARRMLRLGRRVDRTRRVPELARRLAGSTGSAGPATFARSVTPPVFPGFMPFGESAELTASPELAEYAAAHRRLYDAAAEVSGRPVVVDSSKHASTAFCLAAAGLDVHVVHVVRDPRAVAHSWRRRVPRPEDGRPMTRWSPARTSLHWLAQNLSLELLARGGVRVTRVRYEDLLDAPAATLGRVAAEAGLAPRLDFLSTGRADLSPAHTVSGNPVRFTVGRIRLDPDDGWRTAAPPRHRRLVATLTWPLMIKYGYDRRSA
ncbi:sulfotransferase [Streptosporangium sp. NPDC048047]|uniref:sulfotransferase n=1 Tax=Streptosporangium sp. NPDC048047 TaxID=3155748 RepID=UPI0034205C95